MEKDKKTEKQIFITFAILFLIFNTFTQIFPHKVIVDEVGLPLAEYTIKT